MPKRSGVSLPRCPANTASTPLVDHVMGVVLVRPLEQMSTTGKRPISDSVRPYFVVSHTASNVACVPDHISSSQPFASGEFPRDTVGTRSSMIIRANRSIPRLEQTTDPIPANTEFWMEFRSHSIRVGFHGETNGQCDACISGFSALCETSACLRTVSIIASVDSRRPKGEDNSTLLADASVERARRTPRRIAAPATETGFPLRDAIGRGRERRAARSTRPIDQRPALALIRGWPTLVAAKASAPHCNAGEVCQKGVAAPLTRAKDGAGPLDRGIMGLHRATPRCRPRPLTRLRGLSAAFNCTRYLRVRGG